DPAPGALGALVDRDALAGVRLPQDVVERTAAAARRGTGTVGHRQPDDLQALGRVQAQRFLAPALAQAVEVVGQRWRDPLPAGRAVSIAIDLARAGVQDANAASRALAREQRRQLGVLADRVAHVVLAEHAPDLRRQVDNDLGVEVVEHLLDLAVFAEIAAEPAQRRRL